MKALRSGLEPQAMPSVLGGWAVRSELGGRKVQRGLLVEAEEPSWLSGYARDGVRGFARMWREVEEVRGDQGRSRDSRVAECGRRC